MESLFYVDKLESSFGGKNVAKFDIRIYAQRMKDDDAKRLASHNGESSTSTSTVTGRDSTGSEVNHANTYSDSDDEKTKDVNEENMLAEAQKIATSDGGGTGARIEQ
ncbi:hypothetical protein Hdeb2414_s0094g00790171 [Helianthus debilis subsp. tardiflorus]